MGSENIQVPLGLLERSDVMIYKLLNLAFGAWNAARSWPESAARPSAAWPSAAWRSEVQASRPAEWTGKGLPKHKSLLLSLHCSPLLRFSLLVILETHWIVYVEKHWKDWKHWKSDQSPDHFSLLLCFGRTISKISLALLILKASPFASTQSVREVIRSRPQAPIM